MNSEKNPTKQLFESLKENYPLFAEYVTLIEKGLRRQALKVLEQFLNQQ